MTIFLIYIKIVEEKSELRTLIKAANEIIESGYDSTGDVEDIMESAEKKIFNIMQKISFVNTFLINSR